MSAVPPIVRATFTELADVVDLIASAIGPLPLAAWLVPNEPRRTPTLTAWARIWVEHAYLWGDPYLLDDRSGTAVWLTHDDQSPTPVHYQRRLAAACGPYLNRFQHLDKLLAAHRPTEPHHFLTYLAVKPTLHGEGRAKLLLRHHRAARDRKPTYTQAITPSGRHLLTQHGYEQQEPIELPDDAGSIYPMWLP